MGKTNVRRSLFGSLHMLTAMAAVFFSIFLQAGYTSAEQSRFDAQTIIVFGASGKIGGVVVEEALQRGHKVIGVSRNPAKLNVDNGNFSSAKGDVSDVQSFKSITGGADAVVISVQGNGTGNLPDGVFQASCHHFPFKQPPLLVAAFVLPDSV